MNRQSFYAAVTASIFSALLWAAFYVLFLTLPSVPILLVVAAPFGFASVGFLILVGVLSTGTTLWVRLQRLANRHTLLLGIALWAMQTDIVVSTRIDGPFETSLFVLVGDVIGTPLLLQLFWPDGGSPTNKPTFWLGAFLAGVGSSVAIVSHGLAVSTSGALAFVGVPVILLVPFFFVQVARQARTEPAYYALGGATIVAFVLGFSSWFIAASTNLESGPPNVPLSFGLAAIGASSFFAAPLMYVWAAKKITIAVPAVLQAFIPLFTLGLVVVTFHVAPAPALTAAIPLVVLGGLVALNSQTPFFPKLRNTGNHTR